MDYSIYAGSGYPPVKGNLSHGDCSRKVLIGGMGCKSKKHRTRNDKKGGNSTINFSDKMQTVNQYGGFIIDPPIAKCNSQLDNALWLNNHNMKRKQGGIGPKKTVTLKQASGRTANAKFFRFANQQNGGRGQGRMSPISSWRPSRRTSWWVSQKYGGKNKSKKYKKSRKQRKSKKSRRQKRSRKNQKGGVFGGLSGNPLWKNEYQLSYPPNEINPWPPVRNIRPF